MFGKAECVAKRPPREKELDALLVGLRIPLSETRALADITNAGFETYVLTQISCQNCMNECLHLCQICRLLTVQSYQVVGVLS